MKKLGLLSLAAAVLLAVGALAAGCSDGGSDGITLEEYFAELESIDADTDAQIELAYADFPENADAFLDDANLPFFLELTAAFPRIVGDMLDRLNDLDPPAEVEDEHNDLVDAGEDLRAEFEAAAEELGAATTMEEFAMLNDEIDPRLAPLTLQFDSACLVLANIAEENGIDVNITCEDEE